MTSVRVGARRRTRRQTPRGRVGVVKIGVADALGPRDSGSRWLIGRRRHRMRRFSAVNHFIVAVSLAGVASSLATDSTLHGYGQLDRHRVDSTTTSANLDQFLIGPGSTATIAKAVSSTNRPETISYQPTVTGTYKLRVKPRRARPPIRSAPTTTHAREAVATRRPVPTNPATDWPMWHNDPFHLGVSAVSTSAHRTRVAWGSTGP